MDCEYVNVWTELRVEETGEKIKAQLQITCKHDTDTNTLTYNSNFSNRDFPVYVISVTCVNLD
jgi:hypothetical protein